ncbi:hypothetical protein [Thalassotalea eurytherma]|uniref:DUF4397 domain-containing protein n=1 Tax=Thalassotalea eurytherma TaxID=1144278 RepID=A0ABQ6H6W7_9GAMM|nr:hypothetical protein [Thalassotalea eurytherma]GLX82191.1 hypothetical protein theurythT_16430 [Thalassotalea eurytherma]
MFKQKLEKKPWLIKSTCTALLTSLLVACGSSSDDSGVGYVKFYNASSNAPDIIFTVDEDLETSETDAVEITYNGLGYGEALSYAQYPSASYFYELAWQDDDSSERSELAIIDQGPLEITEDTMHFVVIDNDVQLAQVSVYQYPMIADDDDDTYDLFNLRVLNSQEVPLDVYYSKTDETFNEAILFDTANYQTLLENQKLEQGSYIFYLTASGDTDVVFESEEVAFSYSAQYLMAIRENPSNSQSPYLMDRISNTAIVALSDVNAQAQVSFYNAIGLADEYFPEYQGEVDVYLQGTDNDPVAQAIAIGQYTESVVNENGDFSLDVLISGQNQSLLKNHLLSLPENSAKTVFLYGDEEYVDEDGDGDVDEDGDGQVDEIEFTVHSLVVDNSQLTGLYSHQVMLVNLIDDELYSAVNAYFVRSSETITTADNKLAAGYADTDSLTLNNNTYEVYLTAKDNSSDVILASFEMILDETSSNQFLVIEEDDNSPTGFSATLLAQHLLTNSE